MFSFLVQFFFCAHLFNIFYENNVVNAEKDYYVAGVVEYSPIVSAISSRKSVELNLREYVKLIEKAKRKNVDILVFPEATLNYDVIKSRENLLKEAVFIPNKTLKLSRYLTPKYDSNILVQLSRAAKNNQIYILVNLIEKVPCSHDPDACKYPFNTHNDGYSLYNANIVLDRTGRIISKYRKKNLYKEVDMDEPQEQPLSVFETDFNVKFGHFICFDILFKDPAKILLQQNVTNFLYPTYWLSSLPFHMAETIHQGWAYANNVNLIVSGGNSLTSGTTGSGIYIGQKRIQVTGTFGTSIRKMFTAKVPKNPSSAYKFDKPPVREERSPEELLNLNITVMWKETPKIYFITNPLTKVCVDNHRVCCQAEVRMYETSIPDGFVAYKYALIVNSTISSSANRQMGELYCGVVACTDNTTESCGQRFMQKSTNIFKSVNIEHIRVTTNFQSNSFDDFMIMPSTVTTGLLPLDVSNYTMVSHSVREHAGYNFRSSTIESIRGIPEFLVYGLYGRDFSNDSRP